MPWASRYDIWVWLSLVKTFERYNQTNDVWIFIYWGIISSRWRFMNIKVFKTSHLTFYNDIYRLRDLEDSLEIPWNFQGIFEGKIRTMGQWGGYLVIREYNLKGNVMNWYKFKILFASGLLTCAFLVQCIGKGWCVITWAAAN